ncbi:fumarylacetoacetate hydrolase family protein [Plantactinospora sp. KBS50]|uniref:fumarylacetoacetate hydrolase family protein n=1 Tax=Plantactinospora sp. KBS50 TaxID=2024580 RepID=UPI0012FDA24A|nr:fumarylacetoacetate hydrolase family protein [Plantactinospora sp. KBS50]
MRLGILTDGRVVAVDGERVVDVTAVLPGGPTDYPDRAGEVAAYVAGAPSIATRTPTFTAPVAHPRTVLAAPVNYAPHRGELGDRSPEGGRLDARALGLIVLAPGSVVGPDGAIELPDLPGREFHYEGEIAVVIGRPCRGVDRAHAMDHVLGYTGLLDITMRIGPQGQEDRSMRKSFRTFTPIGPVVLTADEVPDPSILRLRLALNGEPRQDGGLDELIVDVPDLVVRAAQLLPLQPGDLIATGTPGGVGAIVPGDRVTLTVDGVGELAMDVRRRSW